MRKDAWLNNQDILHWYKTPCEMRFTASGFPILESTQNAISRKGINTLAFNYAMSYKGNKADTYIHFYIQDYLFNRVWNTPNKYIDILKEYKGIITPDFSWYYDMPKVMQQFQQYRNLWFGRMCQLEGIDVIPSINYSDESSYEWCFEGIPHNNPVMLSSIGSTKDANKKHIDNFYNGARQMIDVLHPSVVLLRTTKNQYNQIIKTIDRDCNFSFVEYIV